MKSNNKVGNNNAKSSETDDTRKKPREQTRKIFSIRKKPLNKELIPTLDQINTWNLFHPAYKGIDSAAHVTQNYHSYPYPQPILKSKRQSVLVAPYVTKGSIEKPSNANTQDSRESNKTQDDASLALRHDPLARIIIVRCKDQNLIASDSKKASKPKKIDVLNKKFLAANEYFIHHVEGKVAPSRKQFKEKQRKYVKELIELDSSLTDSLIINTSKIAFKIGRYEGEQDYFFVVLSPVAYTQWEALKKLYMGKVGVWAGSKRVKVVEVVEQPTKNPDISSEKGILDVIQFITQGYEKGLANKKAMSGFLYALSCLPFKWTEESNCYLLSCQIQDTEKVMDGINNLIFNYLAYKYQVPPSYIYYQVCHDGNSHMVISKEDYPRWRKLLFDAAIIENLSVNWHDEIVLNKVTVVDINNKKLYLLPVSSLSFHMNRLKYLYDKLNKQLNPQNFYTTFEPNAKQVFVVLSAEKYTEWLSLLHMLKNHLSQDLNPGCCLGFINDALNFVPSLDGKLFYFYLKNPHKDINAYYAEFNNQLTHLNHCLQQNATVTFLRLEDEFGNNVIALNLEDYLSWTQLVSSYFKFLNKKVDDQQTAQAVESQQIVQIVQSSSTNSPITGFMDKFYRMLNLDPKQHTLELPGVFQSIFKNNLDLVNAYSTRELHAFPIAKQCGVLLPKDKQPHFDALMWACYLGRKESIVLIHKKIGNTRFQSDLMMTLRFLIKGYGEERDKSDFLNIFANKINKKTFSHIFNNSAIGREIVFYALQNNCQLILGTLIDIGVDLFKHLYGTGVGSEKVPPALNFNQCLLSGDFSNLKLIFDKYASASDTKTKISLRKFISLNELTLPEVAAIGYKRARKFYAFLSEYPFVLSLLREKSKATCDVIDYLEKQKSTIRFFNERNNRHENSDGEVTDLDSDAEMTDKDSDADDSQRVKIPKKS